MQESVQIDTQLGRLAESLDSTQHLPANQKKDALINQHFDSDK